MEMAGASWSAFVASIKGGRPRSVNPHGVVRDCLARSIDLETVPDVLVASDPPETVLDVLVASDPPETVPDVLVASDPPETVPDVLVGRSIAIDL